MADEVAKQHLIIITSKDCIPQISVSAAIKENNKKWFNTWLVS